MIGDIYRVKEDCYDDLHNIWLKRGEFLVESEGYNNETEQREDCGDFNDLVHNEYGFICDAGSNFAKEHLVLV